MQLKYPESKKDQINGEKWKVYKIQNAHLNDLESGLTKGTKVLKNFSNKKEFLICGVFLFHKGQEISLNHIIMLTL